MSTIRLLSTSKNVADEVLRCTFEVDGTLHTVDIGMVMHGSATTLALDGWESLLLGDRQALSEVRQRLSLALESKAWPQTDIEIEPPQAVSRAQA